MITVFYPLRIYTILQVANSTVIPDTIPTETSQKHDIIFLTIRRQNKQSSSYCSVTY